MINSGRNIVLMLVGVVMGAVFIGASQGGAAPAKSKPKPAPAATAFPLSWAEVLEQNPDPKVVTDADFLKRITETKLPWRVKDKATGIEMLLVPPGKFVMGMSPGDKEASDNEKPAHEVTITKAFYLGRTEVTQGQWFKVMDTNPSHFRGESLPVETLSWYDIRVFVKKAGGGLRLPTEAEWEYACRAGTKGATYGDLDLIAWHRGASAETTHAVGKLQPNALGFYDMIGNVWEWTNDWYEGDYYKSCEDGGVDPTGPAESELGARVLRGGGWSYFARGCRASSRYRNAPGIQLDSVGCRVARTAD